jgi:hypothetical protein
MVPRLSVLLCRTALIQASKRKEAGKQRQHEQTRRKATVFHRNVYAIAIALYVRCKVLSKPFRTETTMNLSCTWRRSTSNYIAYLELPKKPETAIVQLGLKQPERMAADINPHMPSNIVIQIFRPSIPTTKLRHGSGQCISADKKFLR